MTPQETYCSCCGVAHSVYEEKGHDPECIHWDTEMYRLADKWLNSPESEAHMLKQFDTNWKQRYDMIVSFLLEEIRYLTPSQKDQAS